VTIDPRALGAIEANLWSMHRDFARIPGAEVHDTPTLLWYTCPSINSWYNGASFSNLERSEADAAIAAVVRDIHARGRNVMWHVGPRSQPADLGRRLEAVGFEVSTDVSMILPIEALNRTMTGPGFVVTAVRTRVELDEWLFAFDLAFEIEPRREHHPWIEPLAAVALDPATPTELFVGRVDGAPVATSVGFQGGGAVGLYGVGTVPTFRGRGFGGAVTEAAIDWGRERGEAHAILHATEMGEPVYRRLGFQAVGELNQYDLPAPANL
jgi:GNAT superfamily N-acetyltransferase